LEELFGLSMNWIMAVLLAIFLAAMAGVVATALRNRIMLRLALRNIPRRPAQTILILVGIMLSSVIMATAFGIGDSINFSIRTEAVRNLGPVDEIIFSARTSQAGSSGENPSFQETGFQQLQIIPYFQESMFQQLRAELAGVDAVDGLTSGIGETLPVINSRTLLSEGRARVVGVDSGSLDGFGFFRSMSGGAVRLAELDWNEAYINDKAAQELDAVPGDELSLLIAGVGAIGFRVKGVVDRGGLAGDASTVIIPLARAQDLFNRPGQVNSMVVSNRGNEIDGADFSEEATRFLRVYFADPAVASELKALLSQGEVVEPLSRLAGSKRGNLQRDLEELVTELAIPEVSNTLISLLADDQVQSAIEEALEDAGLDQQGRRANTLMANLGSFRVLDVKRDALDGAHRVSSGVTTFFIILGLFSIMVGVLLIFLIFVMLAAARRTEMGMARALGAKRRHLVQMFVFEGTAYAVVSAAIGVLIGLGVSALIVTVANRFIGTFEEGFRFTNHFTARSAIVAYCLGMLITFGTVAFSAYRVSRMNIVTAIRGLPEPLVLPVERSFKIRLLAVVRAIFRPFVFALQSGRSAIHGAFGTSALNAGLMIFWMLAFPIWAGGIFVALFRLIWPYFLQGWLTVILGSLIIWWGVSVEEVAPFRIGGTLVIIGVGLLIRSVLRRTALRDEIRDRLSFSFMGVVNLVFWVLPFSTLRAVAGDLEGGREMFFISGISMVAAAVWTVMYNSDLLLNAMTFVSGRFGKMRPVLVTAVAYPMSAKFRTGLTLAMFALVIFTLILLSILTESFSITSDRVALATGGWDIEGTIAPSTPIADFRQAIDDSPTLRSESFRAVGGFTNIAIEARQVEAGSQRWNWYGVRAADDSFLRATEYKIKLIADGYGPTSRDVWNALRRDPNLAVVDASVVPSRSGFGDSGMPFQLEGVHYEDAQMAPIDIEVRKVLSGQVVPLTVIGVLDVVSDNFGNMRPLGMFTGRPKPSEPNAFPVPIIKYRLKLAQGVDPELAAKDLEAAFRDHGMETEVLAEVVEEQNSANRAFNNLFTGYMGMGLLVGIAALGVISLRAVVERRQQIGVQRAIGYRRGMIQLSFLLESSFVALLGIAIGLVLGAVLSYNIIKDIREQLEIETLRFSIPWLQITVIVVLAYLFSLVTTFLPARQASRIHPAEALRYE
jgi:putative ABC transport system permease protein